MRRRVADPKRGARGCRDLARLNDIEVDGFGFISRAAVSWPIAGSIDSYRDFVTSYLPDPWPGPMSELFLTSEIVELDGLISEQRAKSLSVGTLVHGDFDATPIFHVAGRYSGLIDFGELRGAEPLFDLGHFLLHDRESLAWSLFDDLVEGYEEVTRLPDDFAHDVVSSAVLLGLRQLGRWIGPERGWPLDHPAVRRRVRRLRQLLEQLRGASRH